MSCPNLFSLDLSDNTALNDAGLRCIMTNLICLRELSLNRCYNVPPMLYLNCGYLRSLNVIGCTAEQGEIVLKDALRQTKVNSSPFNFTAKPTPPPAVTSIWGRSTK
ncbi:hypothetical protein WR25_03931 [Diploscapter pachys]|nr:hypothetical protein WR25_03931 [Diploscapter pachys]